MAPPTLRYINPFVDDNRKVTPQVAPGCSRSHEGPQILYARLNTPGSRQRNTTRYNITNNQGLGPVRDQR
ncbi:hypothetical protein AFLA_004888 [Aspergillus flavus NRRL3357]|nr:hypothetical protein AFLA_004888 [Aspergillus flavus NRRL3357]